MNTQQTASPKLFIGIDIHKRSWKVHCATDQFSGRSFSMSPDPSKLRCYVSKHFPGHEVSMAYEAGCCGYHAHRCFEGYGWRSLVVNPADIHRKGKEKPTKTDKIDAQLIARELKDGRLESIIIPDKKREELRSLFRRFVGRSYFLFKLLRNSLAVIIGKRDFLKSFPFLVMIISHSDSVAPKYCNASSKSFIDEFKPFSMVCSSIEHIWQRILNFLNFSRAILGLSNFERK